MAASVCRLVLLSSVGVGVVVVAAVVAVVFVVVVVVVGWAVLYAPREQCARVERLCCRAVSSCQQKVNGPEILNKYVGQSEENIRELFKDAEEDQVRVPPRGIPAFRRRSPAFRNSCRSRGWFAKHTRHGVDTHATTGLLAQLLNEGAGDL